MLSRGERTRRDAEVRFDYRPWRKRIYTDADLAHIATREAIFDERQALADECTDLRLKAEYEREAQSAAQQVWLARNRPAGTANWSLKVMAVWCILPLPGIALHAGALSLVPSAVVTVVMAARKRIRRRASPSRSN